MILYKPSPEIGFNDGCLTEKDVFDICLNRLKNIAWQEKKRRVSLEGPHIDDFEVVINGKSAKSYASEGQKRAIAFSIKMAEFEIVKSVFKEPPLVLIDDVFGEFDNSKKEMLDRVFDNQTQIFITCTDEINIGGLVKGAKKFKITDGVITDED